MPSVFAGRRCDVLWAVCGAAVAAAVLIGSAQWAAQPADALVRNSIRLALVWYGLALAGLLQLRAGDWSGRTFKGQVVRWFWTCAWATFVVHVGLAFQLVHHWSHAAAFEHVRQASGFGQGIFMSYLFAVVWSLDVAQWWLSPESYAKRPRWIDRLLHAFMLFIVFNGTVVFESGPIRWASLLGFLVLGLMLILSRTRPRSSQHIPLTLTYHHEN